jgi:replicative superfamily II helicase
VVGDSQRGATVEAVVTRMKMVQTAGAGGTTGQPLRFIAASATLPNTEDVSSFECCSPVCSQHT